MDPLFTPYLSFLERVLTPNRLRHSLGVMQLMSELVPIYQLDRETALLSGLLHDAAKDLPEPQIEQIIQEAAIPVQSPWDRDYVNYLHGPVGAYFVQRELGIQDPLILDAIKMHTFCGDGHNLGAPLVWCLRFSDLLEPNRKWDDKAHWIRDGEPLLRRLVYSGQLNEAAFFQTGLLIRFFEEAGQPVHPNMRQIYQKHAAQPGLDDSWFAF
jgi:predicted HD superfamily hydrolase involved in NAD metabolism